MAAEAEQLTLTLEGGKPWGFRLLGGKDHRAPLQITKLQREGKAALQGVRDKDYILAINDVQCENVLHSEALSLLKSSGNTVVLKLQRGGAPLRHGQSIDAGSAKPPQWLARSSSFKRRRLRASPAEDRGDEQQQGEKAEETPTAAEGSKDETDGAKCSKHVVDDEIGQSTEAPIATGVDKDTKDVEATPQPAEAVGAAAAVAKEPSQDRELAPAAEGEAGNTESKSSVEAEPHCELITSPTKFSKPAAPGRGGRRINTTQSLDTAETAKPKPAQDTNIVPSAGGKGSSDKAWYKQLFKSLNTAEDKEEQELVQAQQTSLAVPKSPRKVARSPTFAGTPSPRVVPPIAPKPKMRERASTMETMATEKPTKPPPSNQQSSLGQRRQTIGDPTKARPPIAKKPVLPPKPTSPSVRSPVEEQSEAGSPTEVKSPTPKGSPAAPSSPTKPASPPKPSRSPKPGAEGKGLVSRPLPIRRPSTPTYEPAKLEAQPVSPAPLPPALSAQTESVEAKPAEEPSVASPSETVSPVLEAVALPVETEATDVLESEPEPTAEQQTQPDECAVPPTAMAVDRPEETEAEQEVPERHEPPAVEQTEVREPDTPAEAVQDEPVVSHAESGAEAVVCEEPVTAEDPKEEEPEHHEDAESQTIEPESTAAETSLAREEPEGQHAGESVAETDATKQHADGNAVGEVVPGTGEEPTEVVPEVSEHATEEVGHMPESDVTATLATGEHAHEDESAPTTCTDNTTVDGGDVIDNTTVDGGDVIDNTTVDGGDVIAEHLTQDQHAMADHHDDGDVYDDVLPLESLGVVHGAVGADDDELPVPAAAQPVVSGGDVYDDVLPLEANQINTKASTREHEVKELQAQHGLAKALYVYKAHTTREISFQRGDEIILLRRVDANWMEGELNGNQGILPVNYVEVLVPIPQVTEQPSAAQSAPQATVSPASQTEAAQPAVSPVKQTDSTSPRDRSQSVAKPTRKPPAAPGANPVAANSNRSEKEAAKPENDSSGGSTSLPKPCAIARHAFTADHAWELGLKKGELVTLLSRVDENWYEGRVSGKKGIFPAAYVEVLRDVEESTNGNAEEQSQGNEQNQQQGDSNASSEKHFALFTYAAQNSDELNLKEGDEVLVEEKCDDGWFVGRSVRTGDFGTFPGNYVKAG